MSTVYGDEFLIKLYNDNFVDKINFDDLKLKKNKKKFVLKLKKFYFDKYIINSECVPKEYLDSKKRILLNRKNSFSKNSEINKVIKFQEKSLEKWIEVLFDNNSDYYVSIRNWILKSIVGLGCYDFDKGIFNKRNQYTIFPFPDINFEALDEVVKSVMLYCEDNENLDDFLNQFDFGKMYSRCLWSNINLNNSKVSDGIWVKYCQGSNYKKLLNAICGKFTSWFFDDDDFIKDYINVSDIIIYFTENYNGFFTMPRIAIVLEQNKIVEIRGISDENQNVEFQLLDVLSDKLDSLNHDKKYDLILDDMRRISDILSKHNRGIVLSKEDLAFIYECDRKIEFFGIGWDYEVLKFFSKRNAKDDYSVIFNCSSDLIGFNFSELSEDLYVFVGDIKKSHDKYFFDLKCPCIVLGDFDAACFKKNTELDNLLFVKGDLFASSSNETFVFKNLEEVKGNIIEGECFFDIHKLRDIESKNQILRKVKSLKLDKIKN